MRRDNNANKRTNGSSSSDYTTSSTNTRTNTSSGDRKQHHHHHQQSSSSSSSSSSTASSSSPRYRSNSSASSYQNQQQQQQQQHQQQQHHQHHHHHHHQHHHHHHHDASTETYYFPGAASLSDHIDNRVMIILRDGKKLVGTLRSYDQFANMVLEDTVERIVVGKNFGDYPLGLYMVRGENVVLMGEIDDVLEDELESKAILNRVSLPQILQEQKELKESQMLLQQQKENGFDV